MRTTPGWEKRDRTGAHGSTGTARKQGPSQEFSAHAVPDIVQNGRMTLRPRARSSRFFSVTFTLSLVSACGLLLLAGCSAETGGSGRPDGGEPDAGEPPIDAARTGSCIAASDCDDGDECTANLCDAVNGECGYRPIDGCCSAASDCDDGNTCTTDNCAPAGTCTHAPSAGCCVADVDCNDADPCTRDTCDVAANTCAAEAIAECCVSGTTRACYEGPPGTEDVGDCSAGLERCLGNRWEGLCTGDSLPAATDACDAAGRDQDCNGIVNDGCACSGTATRDCYTGDASTEDVGLCRGGSQACSGGVYGACTGEVTPGAETCGNSVDEDCDGSDLACPPANDTRATAINLTVRHAETSVTGTTVGATHDGPDTTCSCTSSGNVWYRFTTTTDSVVYFDTASATGDYDTSLFLTDSAGVLLAAQPSNGQPERGLCNDDGGCGGVSGWGTSYQSRTWGYLAAGTYYVAVGGCGSGTFTLRLQNIPITEGYYFYDTRISGDGSDTTFLIGSNMHASTCGGGISGEDVRWFITCGAPQFFSLCEGDGGAYTSRRTATEATRWDPILYTHSGVTGIESRCSSAGASGVDCRGRVGVDTSSTTFDSVEGGARLTDAEITRGLNAILVDERVRGSGMEYRLVWRVRDR